MFAEELRKQNLQWEEIDDNLSTAIHIVERELHVHIDEDYLLVKFFNQLEEIKKYREEEKRQSEAVSAARMR